MLNSKIFFIVLVCSSLSSLAQDLYIERDYVPLTADRRAHQVGDLISVIVLENSSASATAGTKTDKNSGADIKFLSPNSQKSYSLDIDNDFDGRGKISRSGKLLAQISARVVDLESNGDLSIQGEQLIEINGEKQEIAITGKIRPRDIDKNNAVLSTKIADAKITYVGDGLLAETQHKGWLSRLISILGFL